MATLPQPLRKKLEAAVKDARDTAEAGARAALEQIAVHAAEPYGHLTPDQRELRNRLRAHARQLGDQRNAATGVHQIDHLVVECAYEHWHRMLFARFLAENNVLMHPDDVAVTLAECEELAETEDASNGWELAGRYASRMLPQIFRLDAPVLAVELPPEHQRKLEQTLEGLEPETFKASDALGWVYQFWQAKRKDEINAREVKIGADELPAVTQLFTEPYMVSFLLDNSLGAWWAARRLTEDDLKNASCEEELRNKAALPGVPLEYLRFIKQDDGAWAPAAGTFDGWQEHLSELKILDPCCGSGHFLVAAFMMLVPMRMEMEDLSTYEAVEAVLRENIHGLELDQRCVELAAFTLALTAWCYPNAGGYRSLPELNVACVGLAINAKKEEWLALAKDNTNLRLTLEELYKQFKDAPVLGSLINPEIGLAKSSLFEMKWEEVGPLLTKALSGENNDEKTEMGVVARGLLKAVNLLRDKYDLLVTNVPFLSRGKQEQQLKHFCEKFYSSAMGDLSTVFIERLIGLSNTGGSVAFVSPEQWFFTQTYKKFREKVLRAETFRLVAKLGPSAFKIMNWWAARTTLAILENTAPCDDTAIASLDLPYSKDTGEKPILILNCDLELSLQKAQLNNPDSRISLSKKQSETLLSDYAKVHAGIQTGDLPKYVKLFFELSNIREPWAFLQRTVNEPKFFSGRSQIILWNNGNALKEEPQSVIRGLKAHGRKGICINRTASLAPTMYTGEVFDQNGAVLIPKNEEDMYLLWKYLSSKDYYSAVREIDTNTGVAPATLTKVRFDYDLWHGLAEKDRSQELPKPYSDDPTQWIFHGHPSQSDSPLQVAVARLLGYRWPAELDSSMELSDEARAWTKKSEELFPYADEDRIVCIPSVRGEESAEERLLTVLAAAYGEDWSATRRDELLEQVDAKGKGLDWWIRHIFFEQHCKMFQHRPFIWHLWDGLKKDGFGALVNYHKLDRKLLETLAYTYVGDWIKRQQDDAARNVDGASERLEAARALQERLELILEGEKPYDIFVRWKSLQEQPVGWEPDLNDGVRFNIRPFMTVPDVGVKEAGILRWKPNIHWNKDRGKDTGGAPWYHMFKGDRINDHHLSLEEKRQARQEHGADR